MIIFILAMALAAAPFAVVAVYPYFIPYDEQDTAAWVAQLRAMRDRPRPSR